MVEEFRAPLKVTLQLVSEAKPVAVKVTLQYIEPTAGSSLNKHTVEDIINRLIISRINPLVFLNYYTLLSGKG